VSILERIFRPHAVPSGPRQPDRGWRLYTSPTGFYSFHYPEDWTLSKEEGRIELRPSEGSGAVTVSALYGRTSRPPSLEAWLCDAFEGCEAISKPRMLERSGWLGYQQSFAGSEQGERVEWLAVIGWSPHALVLMAARDTPEGIAAQHRVYQQMLQSLELHNPKPPRNRR
jgi:hypothetical protein